MELVVGEEKFERDPEIEDLPVVVPVSVNLEDTNRLTAAQSIIRKGVAER